MPLIGIIDLGSNSIRLVVYETKNPQKPSRPQKAEAAVENGDRSCAKKQFRSVMDKKKIAGLSAYVTDGRLTREGIDCAIEAVQGHVRSANNVGCKDIRLFATAVVRNCDNSKKAADRIAKATGVEVDVISAADEAHLGFVGATCDRRIDEGTLIDIGGGSTELTSVRDGKDRRDVSIPQGSVSSYAEFVKMILPTPDEEASMRRAFDARLDALDGLDDFKAGRLYGIGGSVRAIDKLYAAAFSNDNRMHTLEAYQIGALQSLLQEKPSAFAHAATKAVPERMHTVVPGIVIVRALMEKLGAESLTICKYGVREGYLLERVLQA